MIFFCLDSFFYHNHVAPINSTISYPVGSLTCPNGEKGWFSAHQMTSIHWGGWALHGPYFQDFNNGSCFQHVCVLDHFCFQFFFVVCNFFFLFSKWTSLTELCCRHYKLTSCSCHFSCQWLLHVFDLSAVKLPDHSEWVNHLLCSFTQPNIVLCPQNKDITFVFQQLKL